MTVVLAADRPVPPIPPTLVSAHASMLRLVTSESLSDAVIREHDRLWQRFAAFGVVVGRSVVAPEPDLVLAFLSAMRSGRAPGSKVCASAGTLVSALAGIRYRCAIERWQDPTRAPTIKAFLTGAGHEDADGPRRNARPLEVGTVRAVLSARPAPGVITMRGRVAMAAIRDHGVTAGQVVRVLREDIDVSATQALLRVEGRPVVLKPLPDPSACPVTALSGLLEVVPAGERLPLSVTIQNDGTMRFATSATYEGTSHVAAPLANQIAHAVNHVGGTRAAGVAALNEDDYLVAAWYLDHKLSREMRDEASLLLAWHTGMQRSALTGLRLGVDLHVDADEVVVHRQAGDRAQWRQLVHPAEDPMLCAVAALQRWTRLARLRDGDYIFGRILGKGSVVRDRPMSQEGWSEAWRRLADRCDVDPAQFCAGSPRRGFIRLAREAGATTPRIVAAVGPFSAEIVTRQLRTEARRGSVAGRVGL